MAERVLVKGNEALAEAAIMAGCKHFFWISDNTSNRTCGIYGKKDAQNWRHIFTG